MIDVTAAKAWIKKETSDEDPLIGGLVSAAVATIEAQTGKFMSVKDFTQEIGGFPACAPFVIKLSRGPVTEVAAIEYDPSDGTDPVEIADFRLIEGLNGALLPAYGESWPATLDGPATVRVAYSAGFADGEAPELDQAALMLVAHWYQNREAVSVGAGVAAVELPLAVQMLIAPYRPKGLA
jgi:uncharacterized phiE125 gp8 family phage protein